MKLCKDCIYFWSKGTTTVEKLKLDQCVCPKNEDGIDPVYGEERYKYSPYELRTEGNDFNLSKFGIESKITEEVCGKDGKWFEQKEIPF